MGTEIYLKLGRVTLDWSKNSPGMDHGALFQESDRKLVPYPPDEGEGDAPAAVGQQGSETTWERALGRTLRRVVPRLELLGYTLERAKAEYERHVQEWLEYQDMSVRRGSAAASRALSFDEFLAFLSRHPVGVLDDTYISATDGERARVEARFIHEPLDQIPNTDYYPGNSYSEANYYGSLVGFLDPYALLRVLATCPENLDAELLWEYGPMVESGWATEEDFTPGARRTQKFLIATEGSSDAHIIKRSFALLMPEVEDFFTFIDVSERHPFPGTGNLLKFAEGLIKIDVQNQLVFLFDNDAEGFDAFSALTGLRLPPNMRALVLPDLEVFRSFPARGPEGVSNSDINKRAAAIECYLDLRLPGRPPAQVLWTNYKEERGAWHGRLEHKETYTRWFFEQQSVEQGDYDFSKLRLVLQALVHACSDMAASANPLPAAPS